MAIPSSVKAAGLAALLQVVHGARNRRTASRSFAGVPVHNYRANVEDWMLLFREGTTDETMSSICNGKCSFIGHPNKGGTAVVKVHGNEQVVEEMVRQSPEIMEVVEPDEIDYMIPEIEVVAPQDMASNPESWGLERIGVPTRQSSGVGVHVYVQDTGIRGSHVDFGGRVIPTIDLSSFDMEELNLRECSVTGEAVCSDDRQGHGTHCAGTVAGSKYGVASGASLHAVKTLNDEGWGPRSWQISAIDWVTANGVKPSVLSMSLGGGGPASTYTASILAATKAGVTVIVAAGNLDRDSCTFAPAFDVNAITVGATGPDNKRATYSNWGHCNNIMAPGTDVVSVSAYDNTDWRRMSGTSMACPHVSGAAALLIESGLTYRDDILASMQSTGRVNFIAALRPEDPDLFLWVGQDPAPSPAPTPEPMPLCPSWSRYSEPDSMGECGCEFWQKCSVDGGATWNCPSADGPGAWGGRYFSVFCEECMCYDA